MEGTSVVIRMFRIAIRELIRENTITCQIARRTGDALAAAVGDSSSVRAELERAHLMMLVRHE